LARFDELDMKILRELIRDASQSVPKLSRKINVNTSVVYSRIKRLVRRGLIKRFTVDVNESLLGYTVTAFVGLNVDTKLRDKVLEGLRRIHEVREVYEVTGRFDFIAQVRTKGLEHLHEVIAERIGTLEGVTHTETFIAMRQEAKLPDYELPKS
jgi:Lrp/AsnC family transcriptional regulator for asnA, asnC and gidA